MNIALYLATVLIWGTTWFAITFQLGDVPPWQSVFYRFILAAILMQLWCLIRREQMRFTLHDHLRFAALGLFLFSMNYALFYIATQFMVSGLISVIFSLMLVFNTFMSWLFFAQRPDRSLLIGATLGIIGIALLFAEDFSSVEIDTKLVYGIVLSLVATFLASSGNIVSRSLQYRRIPVAVANAWGMTYGALFLLVLVLFSSQPWVFSFKPDYLLSLFYLTIFGTLLAFWAYLTLLGRIGAGRAAYATVLFPLVALLLSTLYEDLEWSLLRLIAVALVLLGNLVIMPNGFLAKWFGGNQ